MLKESPANPNERPPEVGAGGPGEENRLALNSSGCFFCSAIVDRSIVHETLSMRATRHSEPGVRAWLVAVNSKDVN